MSNYLLNVSPHTNMTTKSKIPTIGVSTIPTSMHTITSVPFMPKIVLPKRK